MDSKANDVTPQDLKILAIAAAAIITAIFFTSALVRVPCALVLVWAGIAMLRQVAIHRRSSQADSGEDTEPERADEPAAAHA